MPVFRYEFRAITEDDKEGVCFNCLGEGQLYPELYVAGRMVEEEQEELAARDAGAATCVSCKGTGYGPLVVGGQWFQRAADEEDYHLEQELTYAIKQLQKEERQRRIQEVRFLGLLQAYIDKPRPSVWEWLRKPAV
jgi:hypothetical protein